MPRVVSHAEVDAVAPGTTLTVEPDAIVTPLAIEHAQARRVTISRDGSAVGAPNAAIVQQVTQAVVRRLGDARPEVMDAVVREVLDALGSTPIDVEEVAPGIDFCQMCLEQERAR